MLKSLLLAVAVSISVTSAAKPKLDTETIEKLDVSMNCYDTETAFQLVEESSLQMIMLGEATGSDENGTVYTSVHVDPITSEFVMLITNKDEMISCLLSAGNRSEFVELQQPI